MKTKLITFVLLAILGTFYIGYGIAGQKNEQEEVTSEFQQNVLPLDELPDITRIEGVGVKNGYAYFIYRKGTTNYLGKIKLEAAVEVIPGE